MPQLSYSPDVTVPHERRMGSRWRRQHFKQRLCKKPADTIVNSEQWDCSERRQIKLAAQL